MEFAFFRSSVPPIGGRPVRENVSPSSAARGLRTRALGSPNGSKKTSRRLQSVQHRSPSRSRCRRRALTAATARYSTTADLRKLLTYDEERGGTPIRLLSARWLLTHFQAEGNETARLEHRQWLEREHPEAFVSGEALERVLAELEERTVKWKKWDEERGGARQLLHEQGGERRVARRQVRTAGRPGVDRLPERDGALSHVARQGAPRPERPQPARHVAARDRVALLGAREAAWRWTVATRLAPRTLTALH